MFLPGFVQRGVLLLTFGLFSLLEAPAAHLVNRYSFTSDASDSVGTAHGTLVGGAVISGGSVVLNGTSAFVDLPNGLISSMTSLTVETWLTDSGSGVWSRIFDFGNSTGGEGVPGSGTQYLFVSPQAGDGQLRMGITVGTGEQIVDWPATRLPVGTLKHVVLTIDGNNQIGRLYVDGVPAGQNLSLTLNPASLGFTVNNWIGRSQFSNDPFLNASITEFRIYDDVLTPTQVQQSFNYGPEVAGLEGPVSVITHPQSKTVTELLPVSFEVQYGGTPPVSLQWLRNGQPIANATNTTYTIAAVALTNHSEIYRVALTNEYNFATYTALSSNAVLTVTADTTAPALVRADSFFPNEVRVTFSEGVRADTATNAANYVITRVGGSLGISGARVGNNTSEIILTTAAQTIGTEYTVTVNGVRDLALAANLIALNSQTNFVASPFVRADIGNPTNDGTLTPVAGGVDMTASGSGISGMSDQFTFGYQSYTNDFDLEVRVAALSFASAWSRAGLMARDGFASNALFAASFATPGPAGCHFESRLNIGGSAAMSGTFPVNYPDTWLRLRRTGNVFDGFASLDGQTWEFLGSSSIGMSNIVQVGLALAAGKTSTSTTAQFRNYASGSGNITTNAPLPFEPLGPSSRRTPLVISEIMYNPPESWENTNSMEFIELWNSGLITEDLTGHKLTGDITYQFPAGTKIAPGQFLVVAKDPVAVQNHYGITCLGPYTSKLPNNGGVIYLLNELGGRMLEVEYDTESPWPVAADGTGHSLVLSRPSYGENDARAWSPSDVIGGSPGRCENYGNEPARAVVINELLAHTDSPQVDYIELFNTSTQAVNLSGAWLSDDADINKYRISDGTIIGARSSLAFTESELGFALSADGEKVFLVNSNQNRVLDAVSFEGQQNGVSFGRYPNGAPAFQPLSTVTQGTSNTPPRLSQLVINEIMYHPISESDDDEYLEIYNRGPETVALDGWRIEGGISFSFPSNATIAAGGYVVVAKNLSNLLTKYPQLNATNAFGNYSSTLANGGERIALAMPEDLISTDGQNVVTNIFYITVDEVTYADGGRWGKWSDGGGSSLELIDPDADNRLAPSWADSDESTKAPWTTIDVTSVLENGHSGAQGTPNRFEFFLQDNGEVLVDNLEFRNNGGANLIPNGTFDAGPGGWIFGGVVRQSVVPAGMGIGGTAALQLISTGRGDAGPNKARIALTSTAAVNPPNTGTVRASVRWLKGSPYIMFRTRGHWMEVSRRLNLPTNCGTPGLPNSRLLANAGPAITDVSHVPVLPAAGQPVVVRARASDPDGLNPGYLVLRYRLDPTATYTLAPMFDNGAGSDAVAGDGIYSAAIPAQGAGTLAAFYITGSDTLGATGQFPAEAPKRECLVRWGESPVAGTIGTYRLWLTAANISAWTSRERNANDPLDATFVYGNSRVVYNVDTMYSGSPFHAPNYNGPLGSFACDYEINFHSDERFLGSEPFVLSAFDVVSGNFFFNDDSAQVDLTGTWIGRKLGQPYNYRRHVHMFMNGQRRGTIYDDTQQPNSELIAEYFPNDERGQLRKIEDWFEFADDSQNQTIVTATLTRRNKTGGEIDTKWYRWNWRPRATDNPDDWLPFTSLVAAVNFTNTPTYLDQVRTWMDVPNFLRPIITHHICGSWDSYAYQRGKNMYAYKPDHEPWRLLLWDIEIALGAGGNGPTDSIYNMHDTVLRNLILNNPAFNREYLRGFQEAVNGPLQPGVADAILDERYANFQQNGVPLISPQFIKSYIASRRNYLLTVIPNAAFTVNNPGYQVVSGSNVLTLTGTGPLSVEHILINGIPYPVTWTSTTAWRVLVPLSAGTNLLALSAQDRYGNIVSNATGSVTANFTGSNVLPEGHVVLNEIAPNPATVGAAFVELFNTHSNFTFDLSNWSINGLGYTFPPGSSLPPRGYLTVAQDAFAFSQAYAITNVSFDQFGGNLDSDGETLTLFRPGVGTNLIVVDRVRYERAAPWPATTNGMSLQLIDATQDNSRVANWQTKPASTNFSVPTPQWVYVTQTATLPASSARIYTYLGSAGEIYVDDMMLVAGTVPGSGVNLLNNGGFESPLAGTWTVSGDFSGSTLSTTVKRSGNSSLRMLATAPGSGNNDSIQQAFAASLPGGGTYTLSFWYLQNSNGSPFVARLNNSVVGSGIYVSLNPLTPLPGTNVVSGATPGQPNSVVTNLPPFPPLWLNEAPANTVRGPFDNFGEREPWLEIVNTTSTNVSLSGYYLTDTYTNLTKWAFAGDTASNGFTIVWCDNQTNQSTTAAIHAALTLAPGTGSIALTRIANNVTQVVDYLNYANLPANWSYGSVPDAQPFYRREMFLSTPGGTNNGTLAPVTVFINEWMADNTVTLADPADGQFEDWFELYNPGTNAVDLGGYYLTDNLANKFQFQIPNNGHYVIPPGGYLLVWADNENNQNSTNRVDLHTSFALSKGGEVLGLFAADGTTIDAVTFGAQTSDVTQGRFPNGSANIYSMPTPTPRAANTVPNTPPTFATITNRYLTLGQTLSLAISASDTDEPPQLLTYSLINPPAGAQIGSTSGVIAWTPNSAPATNNFTVVAIDDGTPSLSATQSFTVIVVPPPTLANFTLNGDHLTFSWMSVPGQFYQVEYKDDLNDAEWIPLGAAMMGTGGPLNINSSITNSPRRFFRLRVLSGEQALLLPPSLDGAVLNNQQFVLSWPTLPGQRFQVEAATGFNPANWTPLGSPLTGTGEVLRYTNHLSDAPRRYYRLALLH
ncbi:MAG TPA: lamin tail domain-containing protein [Verrucomicrobiae bacterium]|nr:lamin tail domain-containing protein [Verrucomicrobiae bacterium]